MNLVRLKNNSKIRRTCRYLFFAIFLLFLFDFCSLAKFLFEHFFPNENLSDLINLDLKFWNHENRSIPRSIHQIWISSRNEKIFQSFQNAANICRRSNPNYHYKLWTNEDLLKFLNENYPWFVSTYKSYRYDMQRIDAMKYFLLFHFGGIYLDLDVECRIENLLDALIPNETKANEPNLIFHLGTEQISANTDIMAAKPFHPFFKLAVSRLKRANRSFYLYHFNIVLTAGPTFLLGIFRQFPWHDHIYFVPNQFLWGNIVSGVNGGTWYGRDTRFFIYLVEHRFVAFAFIFSIFAFIVFILKFLLIKYRSTTFLPSR